MVHKVWDQVTSQAMSMCKLARENVDGALHCLHVHGICVRASACMVQCALCVWLHKLMLYVQFYVYDCMLKGV